MKLPDKCTFAIGWLACFKLSHSIRWLDVTVEQKGVRCRDCQQQDVGEKLSHYHSIMIKEKRHTCFNERESKVRPLQMKEECKPRIMNDVHLSENKF